ncbi:hypothetical protein ES703_123181 [subsurface metagenome]
MLKAAVFVFVCGGMVSAKQGYQSNPFVIKLAIPAPQDSAGGIIVAESPITNHVFKKNKCSKRILVPMPSKTRPPRASMRFAKK